VGLAGIQVNPNSRTLTELESTARTLYAAEGWTVGQILDHTARTAGFPTGSAEHTAIVNSTGNLRKSWLLRNHGVGFHYQAGTVYSECVQQGLSWCYGTWDPAYKFASNWNAMNNSIYNIRQHLNNLAP
jgi:hypothetical protein